MKPQAPQQIINDIAQRQALKRKFRGQKPALNYYMLSNKDQDAIVRAVMAQDYNLLAYVSMKVSHALENAYCEMISTGEAYDGQIEIKRPAPSFETTVQE